MIRVRHIFVSHPPHEKGQVNDLTLAALGKKTLKKQQEVSELNKYNNWCKASKLIAPALTTIWSQIFKMGSWKNNNPAMHNCLLLVISVLLLS